jgi:hypothetical protein
MEWAMTTDADKMRQEAYQQGWKDAMASIQSTIDSMSKTFGEVTSGVDKVRESNKRLEETLNKI